MTIINSYENIEDALNFCIRASNKEIKEVATALWPSDKFETAYTRLVEGLNPAKRAKLSMTEIIFIMHFCGRYDPLYYMADRCLHERPKKRSLEAEQRQAAEQCKSMLEQANKAFASINSLLKERDEVDKLRAGMTSLKEMEDKIDA